MLRWILVVAIVLSLGYLQAQSTFTCSTVPTGRSVTMRVWKVDWNDPHLGLDSPVLQTTIDTQTEQITDLQNNNCP